MISRIAIAAQAPPSEMRFRFAAGSWSSFGSLALAWRDLPSRAVRAAGTIRQAKVQRVSQALSQRKTVAPPGLLALLPSRTSPTLHCRVLPECALPVNMFRVCLLRTASPPGWSRGSREVLRARAIGNRGSQDRSTSSVHGASDNRVTCSISTYFS